MDKLITDVILYKSQNGNLASQAFGSSTYARQIRNFSNSTYLDSKNVLWYVVDKNERKLQFTDELIKQLFDQNRLLRCITSAELKSLFEAYHTNPLGAHLGARAISKKIFQKHYHKNGYKIIEKMVSECKECQMQQNIKRKTTDLKPIISNRPFERLVVDLIGPLEKTINDNQYICVCIDHFTKWVEAFPIKNKTADIVADILYNNIICRYGNFKILQTDKGSEFCNQVIKNLVDIIKIKHITSSAYHPQTYGVVERANQTLIKALAKFVNEQGSNWDMYLNSILFALNTKEHTTTKISPFKVLYKINPVIPGQLPEPAIEIENIDQKNEINLENFSDMYNSVVTNMKNVAKKLLLDTTKYTILAQFFNLEIK